MSINPKSLKEILKLKFDDFFYYFQNDKPYKVSTKKITDYITDNVLGVLPPILDKHSQITLDDGTNPHGTTKSDVGLGNVDNTSDVNKPISSATALEFVNVYNEVSTKANNYVDIANIISGYTLLSTDAGKLITNSGVNVRSLNIPSGLALPNNIVFVKGRVSITPASGVVVELPDGTTITNSAQFACLANTQYVLHRKEFGGDEWILLALGSAKNLGNSNLEITDATRTVEMGTGSRILKFLSNAVEKVIFNTASGSPTLQANKSGNGAAIRANKTSGTGSALEIAGGTTDFGNNKGINLADPTEAQDASTKAYADSKNISVYDDADVSPLTRRTKYRVVGYIEAVDDSLTGETIFQLRASELADFNSTDIIEVGGVFKLALDTDKLYIGNIEGLATQKTLSEVFDSATEDMSTAIFHVVDNKVELLVPTGEIIVGDALNRGRSSTISAALDTLAKLVGDIFKNGVDNKLQLNVPQGYIIRGNANAEGEAQKLIQGNNKVLVSNNSGVEEEVDLISFFDLLTATGVTSDGVLNTTDLSGTARGVLGSWKITDLVIENTTANNVTINLGTTPGGNDVLNNTLVSGFDFKEFTPLIRLFFKNTEQPIYASSSNWNSASLIIKFSVKKVF